MLKSTYLIHQMLNKLKLALIILLIGLNPALILAQSNEEDNQTHRSLLPQATETTNIGCRLIIKEFQDIYYFGVTEETTEDGTTENKVGSITRFFTALDSLNSLENQAYTQDDILGCAIITGRIKFAYLNIFIFYVLSWLSVASGVVAMIFIIIGGYKYVIGGLTEKQDEGKATITNALIGLLVSTGAWIIISIIQSIVSR